MNKIVNMEFGSKIYGTSVPSSDTDYKAIYIPNPRDILLQQVKKNITQNTKLDKTARNESIDVDVEIFSMQEYLKLLLQGQTAALDMLFTPEKHWLPLSNGDHSHEAWRIIQDNKNKFIHSGVSSFVGYCRLQANKYGIKGSRIAATRHIIDFLKLLPSPDKLYSHWGEIKTVLFNKEHCEIVIINNPAGVAEEYISICNRKLNGHVTVKHAIEIYQKLFNEYGHRALLAESNQGVDWKALMHAVRVAEEAKELLSTGHITFPRPEASLLLQIRKGELPYKEVAELIEQRLYEINNIKTILPPTPNHQFAEDLVFDTYKNEI